MIWIFKNNIFKINTKINIKINKIIGFSLSFKMMKIKIFKIKLKDKISKKNNNKKN
jgi:hypothetical protein